MKKYLNNCKHCKKNFETIKEDKEFCCSNHKKQFNKVPKIKNKFNCECCGEVFYSYKKNLRACSRKCITSLQNDVLRKKKYDENVEKYKNVADIPTCKICGYKSTSLQQHLINHGLTVDEYRNEYNVSNSEIFHSTYIDGLSNRIKGDKNPGYNHGGRFSPYSDKFVKYDNLTQAEKDEEKNKIVKRLHSTQKKNGNYSTTIDYYINKGMSREDATQALIQRQTTFSLEKCIEKHGKEKGYKIWQARQEKWLSNYKKSNYSKVSQLLFKEIHVLLSTDVECFYANVNSDDKNDEFILKTDKSFVKPDFFIPLWNKIIEFDGDYWHQPKNAGSGTTYEEQRDEDIMKMCPYMSILHIREQDYRNNKEGVVKKCLDFLKE